MLAGTLRTDRARLRPRQPDGPATATLRATVRARRDLVAHPQRAFPSAVGLFAELDSPIGLAFLARFDCQDRADWLSPKRLAAWLTSVGYCGCKDLTVLFGRITNAVRGTTGEDGAALAHTTRAFLTVLTSLVEPS
ncbi:hypothetical protein [Saccharopolyspora pogona]|uniref:hypothetical protein n=1 Tax=Saccharopolyspora pogona TaxID=333966 RepID=UPI001CC237CF|nr:hypothetical protein [Saccharopolyspora pogona]